MTDQHGGAPSGWGRDGPPDPGEVTVLWVSVDPNRTPSRGPLVLIVVAAVVAALGVTAGVIWWGGGDRGADPGPVTAPTVIATAGGSTANATAPSTPAATEPTITVPTTQPERFPSSTALGDDQYVVPRGRDDVGRLYLGRVGGRGALERLPTPRGHRVNGPTLTRDRTSLVYLDRTAGTARVMAVDGSGDRLLFERPRGCASIGHLSWNPVDPTRMVLECVQSPTRAILMVVTDEGERVRVLNTGRGRVQDPAISPDGRTVAYWATARPTRSSPAGGAIYTLRLDGRSAPKRLTADRIGRDADPAWSPDGRSLAFRRRVGPGDLDVYVMRADGRGVRALLTGRRIEEKPAWSPDGRRLLVVSDRRAAKKGASFDLYAIRSSGRGLTALRVTSKDLTTPVWSFR